MSIADIKMDAFATKMLRLHAEGRFGSLSREFIIGGIYVHQNGYDAYLRKTGRHMPWR